PGQAASVTASYGKRSDPSDLPPFPSAACKPASGPWSRSSVPPRTAFDAISGCAPGTCSLVGLGTCRSLQQTPPVAVKHTVAPICRTRTLSTITPRRETFVSTDLSTYPRHEHTIVDSAYPRSLGSLLHTSRVVFHDRGPTYHR